jgi:hypothetical protein
VNGRNGVRLNNGIVKRGTDAILSCGDIIEVANTSQEIEAGSGSCPLAMRWARSIKLGWIMASSPGVTNIICVLATSIMSSQHAHPQQSQNDEAVPPSSSGGPSLAPAPRFLKRQVTPPPRSPDTAGQRTAKQSPLYNRGMMMGCRCCST